MSTELENVRALWVGLVESLAPPAGIPDWRIGFEEMLAPFPIPDDAKIEHVDADGVPAILVTAAGASDERTVMWTHSGGYVFGSAHSYRSFGASLSAASGAQVLLVEYRMAPEHTHPAALDDAKAAYRWLLAQGHAPASIVVAGDSAGGGLAAATMLALADDGDPLPAAGVLVSPFGDFTLAGKSMKTRADRDPVASEPMLGALGAMYAGEAPLDDRYLSPALADLSGLPPLLVLVGTEEVLYDDAVRIVAGVEVAGGQAQLVTGEGQYHIWPLFASMLKEGQEAVDGIGEFIRSHTGGTKS